MIGVEHRIPVDARRLDRPRQRAQRRMEHEDPQHAGDGGSDRVGPDQERLEGVPGLQVLVGLRRQQERAGQRQDRDGAGEDHRGHHRAVIFGLLEQRAVILEADEFRRQAERVLEQEGLPDRLRGRPVEEDEGNGELREDQQIGQQLVRKEGSFFHRVGAPGNGGQRAAMSRSAGSLQDHPGQPWTARDEMSFRRSGAVYLVTVRSNWRRIALLRVTAVSRASLAGFWPARAASISSDTTSRICTMLPKRRPREFSVGSLLVSSISARLQDRVLLVEARRLGLLVGRLGDRQIARFLVQLRLAVGVGQEREELGDALVFVRLLAAHHPQRSAADDRVLRSARGVRDSKASART